MKSIAVFCDSKLGTQSIYLEMAKFLGEAIAKRNLRLIFAGSEGGIMGELARAVIRHNGEAIGIYCQTLSHSEVIYDGLENLEIVQSMDEQKSKMAELADAFIALPGGLSTLQNIIDMLKLATMGIHKKPCGILNIGHFYSQFVDFLDFISNQEFIDKSFRSLLLVDSNPWGLLKQLDEFSYPKAINSRYN